MHLFAALMTIILCLSITVDAGLVHPYDGTNWIPGKEQPTITNAPLVIGNRNRALQNGDRILGIGNQLVTSTQNAAETLSKQKPNSTVSYLVQRGERVLEIPVQLTAFRTAGRYFGFFIFLSFVYMLTGAIVYRRGHKAQSVRLFFRMSLLFAIFFLTNLNGPSYFWGDIVTRNAGVFSRFMLPAIFLHFFLVFPEKKFTLTKRPFLEPILYILPTLFYIQFSITQFTGDQPDGIYASRWLIMGSYFTAGIIALLHSYLIIKDPLQRQRLRILTFGTLIGVFPFLALTALPGVSRYETMNFLGNAPMLLLPMSFGYSIARYKVMNIEHLLRRSLTYTVTTGIVIATYLAATLSSGTLLLHLMDISNRTAQAGITLLIAAILWPLRSKLQKEIDKGFFRSRGNLATALSELSREIPEFLQREQMVDHISNRLCNMLGLPGIATYVPGSQWKLLHQINLQNPEELSLPAITNRLSEFSEPFWVEQKTAKSLHNIETQEQQEFALRMQERELLAKANIALLVPMNAGKKLVGMLAIPHRTDSDRYSLQDIELLSSIARQMALQFENSRLIEEELNKQKLEAQLSLARDIQSRLLPSTIPEIDGHSIAACNISSAEVSGDYYDLIQRDNGTLALVISDVSGKGMPASLLASSLQASLRAHCQSCDSPSIILDRVNKYLYQSTDSTLFATLFLAILDPDNQTISYCSGGHNPPVLQRANGTLELLEAGGLPLGAFDFSDYSEATVPFTRGDSLLMYTDGLTETFDADDNDFGENRLMDFLKENQQLSAEQILSGLRTAVKNFSGKEQADDDITIVVLQAASEAVMEGR